MDRCDTRAPGTPPRPALVALLLGLLLSLPAHAEYDYMIPAQSYLGMARAATLHNIGQTQLKESAGRAFSSTSTAATAPARVNPAALSFTPSPQVRAEVRASLIDGLSGGKPDLRSKLEQALGGDAVLKQFDRLLQNYGYSSTNIADVMTAYSIIAWEVVNGADASHNMEGIRSVNAQLRGALLSNARLSQLADEQKQRIAEVMAYQTVLAAALSQRMIRDNNQSGLQQLRTQVRQAALQWGDDPQRLRLTARGFVRTS